jgi:hypothetical protein
MVDESPKVTDDATGSDVDRPRYEKSLYRSLGSRVFFKVLWKNDKNTLNFLGHNGPDRCARELKK